MVPVPLSCQRARAPVVRKRRTSGGGEPVGGGAAASVAQSFRRSTSHGSRNWLGLDLCDAVGLGVVRRCPHRVRVADEAAPGQSAPGKTSRSPSMRLTPDVTVFTRTPWTSPRAPRPPELIRKPRQDLTNCRACGINGGAEVDRRAGRQGTAAELQWRGDRRIIVSCKIQILNQASGRVRPRSRDRRETRRNVGKSGDGAFERCLEPPIHRLTWYLRLTTFPKSTKGP
jgi:hypothetical protein